MHQKLSERMERTDGGFCCYLCGDEIFEPAGWHLDHVTPLILRGPHIVDNLEAACDVCNLRKGDLALDKFLTPTEYAEFMAGGGLPPFKAIRERPTAELWARSPKVAQGSPAGHARCDACRGIAGSTRMATGVALTDGSPRSCRHVPGASGTRQCPFRTCTGRWASRTTTT